MEWIKKLEVILTGILSVAVIGVIIWQVVSWQRKEDLTDHPPLINLDPPITDEPAKNLMHLPTEWKCFKAGNNDPAMSTPVRKNIRGDVECMSLDGIKCLRGFLRLGCAQKLWQYENDPRLKPLSCGSMYKRLFNQTGYENSDSWCSKSRDLLS